MMRTKVFSETPSPFSMRLIVRLETPASFDNVSWLMFFARRTATKREYKSFSICKLSMVILSETNLAHIALISNYMRNIWLVERFAAVNAQEMAQKCVL